MLGYQTTVKSLLGQTLGATSVHMYRKAVAQERVIRTQKPKLLEMSWSVVRLAEVQFVISMPTYTEARHM